MATLDTLQMAAAPSLFMAVCLLLSLQYLTEAQMGVCYGRKGNNLPSAQDVVNLYDYYGIGAMRLYDPDQLTLKALQGTGIILMLGVPNEDVECIACDQPTADEWVSTNVVPYAASIKYIAVGNEVHPTDPLAPWMAQAMQNIQNALNSNNLGNRIKVSTAVDTSLITNSYPPSHSEFKNLSYITPIINFLTTNDSPLLVNIQPYVAYVDDPKNITLDFVLFTACGTVFTDDKTGKQYQNLFDALYDAMYVAIEKVVALSDRTNSINNGASKTENSFRRPVTSESGYSSGGFSKHSKKNHRRKSRYQTNGAVCGTASSSGEAATPENAKTYYTNLIKHVKQGTPLTPGQEIETYLFAMFDEDQKPGDVTERYYGLFTPDKQPKYGILDIC